MPQRNWEQERERLRAVYAVVTDAELQEVANDADFPSEVARATLRAEMLRRGLQAPTETNSELGKAEPPTPKPVIVASYRDLDLATLMNSLLDSAGIEGFLADDTMIRLDWLISNALGGIKVWTRGDEAREARELLEAGIPETFEVEGIGPYQQPKCPNCGSFDISFEELDRKIAHLGLLISIPIPAIKRGWNGHGCGRTWDEPVEPSVE